MRKVIRIFDIILAGVCAVLMGLIAVGNGMLPDSIVTYDGNEIPFSAIYSYADTTLSDARWVDSQSANPRRRTVRLFGVVPVKDVTITNRETQQVYVSGQPFGIKLYTDGVIVVGTQGIDTDTKRVNPAKDAGIEVGDIIVEINGTRVYSSDQVQEILNDNNGRDFVLKIKRDGRYRAFSLKPAYDSHEGCYKAGMWVRDSTAGIGTITFFNPQAGTFGALGHQVNDVDTNEIMPMLEGEAVGASVSKIQKGSVGSTGSLVCSFGSDTIGKLKSNTYCGVYGDFSKIPDGLKKYPVASKQEVQKGPAKIICTVDDSGPQEFDVYISRISYNKDNQQRNILLRVADKRLVAYTGGIVQGMSGSPIIQNGKLVGAVTHVIISNPQRGYGIFAQTMLEQSDK